MGTTPDAELAECVAETVRTVPRGVLQSVCTALDSLAPDASVGRRRVIVSPIIQSAARTAIDRLVDKWCSRAPDVSPRELAWALRAAQASADLHHRHQRTELVWTGPSSAATALRRTDQVLEELIDSARQSVFIVTFAAYRVPSVAAALERAAQRGVRVSFVLEDPDTQIGKSALSAIRSMTSGGPPPDIYIWPLHQRGADGAGHHGSLHVKCAVADEAVALVSSANLTGHALNLNMELGVLLRSRSVAREIADHFRLLIASGILLRV